MQIVAYVVFYAIIGVLLWKRESVLNVLRRVLNVLRRLSVMLLFASRRKLVRFAMPHARALISDSRRLLGAIEDDHLPMKLVQIHRCIVRWFFAAPLFLPLYVLTGLSFVWLISSLIRPRSLERRAPRPGELDPLGWVLDKAVAFPGQVRSWNSIDDPLRYFEGLLWVYLCYLAIRFFVRFSCVTQQSRQKAGITPRGVEGFGRPRRHYKGNFSDFIKCWPVVFLLLTAMRCEIARRALTAAHRSTVGSFTPLSMRQVERIIWRTSVQSRSESGNNIRRHYRRAINEHTAEVVSVLRKVEIEQSSDPVVALRKLTVLLLTIAHRYAEGRIGQLLENDQLVGGKPVMPRIWLRYLASAFMCVGVMTIAVVLGLPEAATVPLLPLVVIGSVVLFVRGSAPGAKELTDLVIPR